MGMDSPVTLLIRFCLAAVMGTFGGITLWRLWAQHRETRKRRCGIQIDMPRAVVVLDHKIRAQRLQHVPQRKAP